jgi:hypothetical protein
MNQNFAADLPGRQTGFKRAPPCVARRRPGSALPPSDHTRRSLILIDAESHLDCRAAVRGLYKKWGFQDLPFDPRRAMIVRMVDLRASFADEHT